MKRAIDRGGESTSTITISEHLADLAQAFQERHVVVAAITLTRGKEIYEHMVASADPAGVLREIEGRFQTSIISVTCLSSLSADLNAELQTLTTTAATAALGWAKPATGLTLVKTSPSVLTGMLGFSKQMRELLADIERAARSTHVVLILGESGTGKTTAASMIHERSARSSKPFIDINCAAIPDTLVESELFGHEKGAFTGAIASKRGLFELADHGTLLLDEIGELKLELQAKLLTAIDQQKIRRLGGTKDINCDIRIIAASSRNLKQMVAQGKFREDLYYRLSVLEVPISPLRDRSQDIPTLVRDRFIHEQQRAALPNPFEIEDGGMSELMEYQWPGNIRQLHNVIARLALRAECGKPIARAAVQKELARFIYKSSGRSILKTDQPVFLPADCSVLLPGESLQQFTARVKRTLIETVRGCAGSMTATSVRLDFDRSALTKLLSRLSDDEYDGRVKRKHRELV